MKKSFPSRRPKEVGFLLRPDRPKTTICDGRRPFDAKDSNHLLCTKAVTGEIFPKSLIGEQMGEVVQFVAKRDLERARLIQEAHAIYETVFPTEKGRPASLPRDLRD
jgi:hypothetical protein